MTEFCSVSRNGHLLVVTLERPQVLNALHLPAHDELAAVFDDFLSDPSLWVAVITGAGDRAFCVGNDLRYQASGGSVAMRRDAGFAGLTFRSGMTKPLIAAVNGMALGGGFEIALACDVIIADERAIFALPEVNVGVCAGSGLHRLPRAVGLHAALGMILTGRRLTAVDGLRLGFVNEVAPPGTALDVALRWADQMLSASPLALQASKQAVYEGLDHAAVSEAIHGTYQAVEALRRSADYREGPRAFAEKRRPNWTGM